MYYELLIPLIGLIQICFRGTSRTRRWIVRSIDQGPRWSCETGRGPSGTWWKPIPTNAASIKTTFLRKKWNCATPQTSSPRSSRHVIIIIIIIVILHASSSSPLPKNVVMIVIKRLSFFFMWSASRQVQMSNDSTLLDVVPFPWVSSIRPPSSSPWAFV